MFGKPTAGHTAFSERGGFEDGRLEDEQRSASASVFVISRADFSYQIRLQSLGV
jgi:hypothetical protein